MIEIIKKSITSEKEASIGISSLFRPEYFSPSQSQGFSESDVYSSPDGVFVPYIKNSTDPNNIAISHAEKFAGELLADYELRLMRSQISTSADSSESFPFAKFFLFQLHQELERFEDSDHPDGYQRLHPMSLAYHRNHPLTPEQQAINNFYKEYKYIPSSSRVFGSLPSWSRSDVPELPSTQLPLQEIQFDPKKHPGSWGDYWQQITDFRYNFIASIMQKYADRYKPKFAEASNKEELSKEIEEEIYKEYLKNFQENIALPGFITKQYDGDEIPAALDATTGQVVGGPYGQRTVSEGRKFKEAQEEKGDSVFHPWLWQAFGRIKSNFSPLLTDSPLQQDPNFPQVILPSLYRTPEEIETMAPYGLGSDATYWLQPEFYETHWSKTNRNGQKTYTGQKNRNVLGSSGHIFPMIDYLLKNPYFNVASWTLDSHEQNPFGLWSTSTSGFSDPGTIFGSQIGAIDGNFSLLWATDPQTGSILPYEKFDVNDVNNAIPIRPGSDIKIFNNSERIVEAALASFLHPSIRGSSGGRGRIHSNNPYYGVNFGTEEDPLTDPVKSGSPLESVFVPVIGARPFQANEEQGFIDDFLKTHSQMIAQHDRAMQIEALLNPNRHESGLDKFMERRGALRQENGGYVFPDGSPVQKWATAFGQAVDDIENFCQTHQITKSPNEILRRLEELIQVEHGKIDRDLGELIAPQIPNIDGELLSLKADDKDFAKFALRLISQQSSPILTSKLLSSGQIAQKPDTFLSANSDIGTFLFDIIHIPIVSPHTRKESIVIDDPQYPDMFDVERMVIGYNPEKGGVVIRNGEHIFPGSIEETIFTRVDKYKWNFINDHIDPNQAQMLAKIFDVPESQVLLMPKEDILSLLDKKSNSDKLIDNVGNVVEKNPLRNLGHDSSEYVKTYNKTGEYTVFPDFVTKILTRNATTISGYTSRQLGPTITTKYSSVFFPQDQDAAYTTEDNNAQSEINFGAIVQPLDEYGRLSDKNVSGFYRRIQFIPSAAIQAAIVSGNANLPDLLKDYVTNIGQSTLSPIRPDSYIKDARRIQLGSDFGRIFANALEVESRRKKDSSYLVSDPNRTITNEESFYDAAQRQVTDPRVNLRLFQDPSRGIGQNGSVYSKDSQQRVELSFPIDPEFGEIQKDWTPPVDYNGIRMTFERKISPEGDPIFFVRTSIGTFYDDEHKKAGKLFKLNSNTPLASINNILGILSGEIVSPRRPRHIPNRLSKDDFINALSLGLYHADSQNLPEGIDGSDLMLAARNKWSAPPEYRARVDGQREAPLSSGQTFGYHIDPTTGLAIPTITSPVAAKMSQGITTSRGHTVQYGETSPITEARPITILVPISSMGGFTDIDRAALDHQSRAKPGQFAMQGRITNLGFQRLDANDLPNYEMVTPGPTTKNLGAQGQTAPDLEIKTDSRGLNPEVPTMYQVDSQLKLKNQPQNPLERSYYIQNSLVKSWEKVIPLTNEKDIFFKKLMTFAKNISASIHNPAPRVQASLSKASTRRRRRDTLHKAAATHEKFSARSAVLQFVLAGMRP